MTAALGPALPLARAVDLSSCGGKAANLARLMAVGLPVPEGYVLTAAMLERGDLDIGSVMALMTGPSLIVRSSAIGEDSEDASFAGQLDSVPNVTTETDLRNAIARVWASQRSQRVVAYQRLRDKPLAGMAILIQRQVEAAISGVLFTVSPVNAGEMLLEYCAGLGEALVQGEINPGRIAISRGSERWTQLAAPEDKDATLNAEHVVALRSMALRIEAIFGHPQDIEWTLDHSGHLWIVQSRPITQLRVFTSANREQRTANREPRPQVWSNANVNENFPDPISPLLYSIARAGYYHYFRNLGVAFGISGGRLNVMEPALRQIIGVHGARMYYNLTSIHSVLRSAPFGDLLAASFNQFVGAEDTSAKPVSTASRLRQALEVVVIAMKVTWQYAFVTRRVQRFERTVDDYAASSHPDRLGDKPLAGLLADFRSFLDIRNRRWTNASLADAGSMVCYSLLQRLLARAFPGRDQQALHNTLLKALPDLVSGMPPLKLWDLSRMIRADRDLWILVEHASATVVLDQVRTNPQFWAFRNVFEEFLESWGFRCSSELMLTAPSFHEEPARVLELLKGYAAKDGESPAQLLERQAAERECQTRDVLRTLRGRSLWLWLVTRTVLTWTQRSIQLRERARLKQALLYSRLRRVALAMGDRLVEAGRMERPDDIFMLTADEVESLASGSEMFPWHVKSLVALRRRSHAEVRAAIPPDSFELREGEYYNPADCRSEPLQGRPTSGLCTGIAACGGTSTAAAAILIDVTESHKLTAGDILVTRQTDPGWGPIFPLISGLVIERGGMLSHGAIIAREFGIPSVVGVKDATRRIAHGSRITVDGDQGIVCLAGGEAG